MEIIETNIDGVLIIEPRVFKDERGYFFESFSQREFDEKVTPILGHSINFVQDNESMSSYGVMRGLHFQRMPYTQSKLVRCVKGAVLDVAVDIRKGSPTFGQHAECLLAANDEEGKRILDEYNEKLKALSSLCREASHMALPYCLKLQFFSTNVITSITPRLTAASTSRTTHLALTGVYLLRRRYSVRRT